MGEAPPLAVTCASGSRTILVCLEGNFRLVRSRHVSVDQALEAMQRGSVGRRPIDLSYRRFSPIAARTDQGGAALPVRGF